jgi:integrase/recombinase XerD
MFDVYFCPRVVARLQSHGDAEILKRFLAYLHDRGHARLTIQTYVHAAESFLRWLQRHRLPLATVDESIVRRFACRQRKTSRPRANVHASLRHLLRHLREARRIAPRANVSTPAIERILSDYEDHLTNVCGVAVGTKTRRRYYVRKFLEFVFRSQRMEWKRLRPCHLQAFIAQYGRNGRVGAAQAAAVALRSFLRWLQFRGRIAPNLIGAVPRFPRWRLAALPSVMTDDQLRIFLASFGKSVSGRRNYAMALCMADLGLRAAEVADLMLDAVDQTAGTLRMSASKSRRERVLPMSHRLRLAVANYVRRYRPETDNRRLFVRHRVPVGEAVTRELVRGVMRRAYASVPGCEDWTGTHVLRHTAATRLHRAGADLKRVADILGHRSLDTTAIYAKVDFDRLVQVALPWPGRKEAQP